jgi:hypothetical protein
LIVQGVLLLVAFFWGIALWIGKTGLIAWLDSMPPTCPLRVWFGFKCAFCGMTHALIHFLFFDLQSAFTENLLSVPLFVLSLSGLVIFAIRPGSRDGLQGWIQRSALGKSGALSAIGLLAGYAILRNLAKI